MNIQKQFGNWVLSIWPWTEYPSCNGSVKPCFHFEDGLEFIWPITKKHSFHFALININEEKKIQEEVEEMTKEEQCSECGQVESPAVTGEYPCPTCDMPLTHDAAEKDL